MDSMNVFQQCWKNWSGYAAANFDLADHAWLNELNQAIFARLEKNLPAGAKVRAVTTPRFLYYTEAAGGYGVDAQTGTVDTRRIVLMGESFEDHVESAVSQILKYASKNKTLFFYTPVAPLGTILSNGEKNRKHMAVRIFTTGETVDV